MTYFDLMGQLGMEFLHPGGKRSTDLLIEELAPAKGMKILEIGCGTGATAVKLCKTFKSHITATDTSKFMLKAAKQRAFINFSLRKITFIQIDTTGRLPFTNASFDAVYSESVLGIAGEECIPVLIGEISRVLKPGGKFICNDAIWNSNASREEIKYLTDLGRRDFGVSVCASYPAYLEEWLTAYEQAGLKVLNIHPLDTITPADSKVRKTVYHYYRRAISAFNPFVRKQKQLFFQWENKHHRSDMKLLDAFLFVSEKQSS